MCGEWSVYAGNWRRKEGRGKKMAKIFLSVTINRFFFWTLNAVFVFKLSGFQGGLPGIDVGSGQKHFPEMALEMHGTELHAVCESHPCLSVLSSGACSVFLCRAQGMRTLFSQCLRCAQCSTKATDGQVLEIGVPAPATAASWLGRAFLLQWSL